MRMSVPGAASLAKVSVSIALVVTAVAWWAARTHAEVQQVPSNTWAVTGSMGHARSGASATLLGDGQVLLAGGSEPGGPTASAERYNPDTGTFTPAPPLAVPRTFHSATLLKDGRVLVAGGLDGSGAAVATTEIFDPVANAWFAGPLLSVARSGHSATRLPDGRVVIAGGDIAGVPTSAIDLFDPDTSIIAPASVALATPRSRHGAALLADGRILFAGGYDGSTPVATTEIYDAKAGLITVAGNLANARYSASATTLLDGRVLVAGGVGANGELASAEIFDPATGSFAPAGNTMAGARVDATAILLPHNNQVLIVGGTTGAQPLTTVEMYVPWQGAAGSFCNALGCADGYVAPASPAVSRTGAAAAALSFPASATRRTGPADGLVITAGGIGQSSAELLGFATVTTDKDDYAPGSTVTIRGSGWEPGEWVALTLRETPLLDEHPLLDVQADSQGRIVSTEFVPDEHDIDVRFTVTAYGTRSQARTAFTDTAPTTGGGTMTVSPAVVAGASTGNTLTFTFTNTASGTSSAYTAGSQVSLQVPAGWTPPQNSDPNGDGYVSVAGCTASIASISAGLMTVNQTCAGGASLTITYGAGGSANRVTAPAGPAVVTFASASKLGAGAMTALTAGSPSVTVTGAAASLAFVQQPTDTPTGNLIFPYVTVEVRDAAGNRVVNSTDAVTLAKTAGSPAGTIGGFLTRNAVKGLATFSTLAPQSAGNGFALTAASGSLTGTTSTTFNVTSLNSCAWLAGAGTGSWFDTTKWSCGVVPTSTTNVTIPSNTAGSPAVVNISAGQHAAAWSLQIGGANTQAASVVLMGDASLTVSNLVQIVEPTNSTATQDLQVNAGTLLVGNSLALGVGASVTTSRPTKVTLTTGTATVSGSLIFNDGGVGSPNATSSQVVLGTGTFNLGGEFLVKGTNPAGTLLGSTGTFNYNGAAPVTKSGTVVSGPLDPMSGDSPIVGTNTRFTKELSIGDALYDPGGNFVGKVYTLTDDTHLSIDRGPVFLSGTYKGPQRVVMLSGLVYGDLLINNTAAEGATLGAAITGGGTGNVRGRLRIGFQPDGSVNHGGMLNDANLTITGGAFDVADGGTFRLIGKNFTNFPTLGSGGRAVTLAPKSTIDYGSFGPQNVAAFTYGSLSLSGTDLRTVTYLNGIQVRGDFLEDTGSFPPTGTGTFTFMGDGDQFINSPHSGQVFLPNVVVNKPSGSIKQNVYMTGKTFAFTQGVVTTNGFWVSADTTTGGSVSSHVNGSLSKGAPTTGTYFLPIGKNGAYRPLSVGVTTGAPGTVQAEQFESSLAVTPPGGAVLFPDRFWRVSGVGATFTLSLDGTGFTPANTSKVVMLRKFGATVTAFPITTFSAPNYTATVTGGFQNDYALAEDNVAPTVAIDSVTPNPTTAGTTVTWHASENGTYSVRVSGTTCSDGTVVGSGTYSTSPATVATAITAASLAEGANTVRVCVTDLVNNAGSTMTTVTKDTVPPTVTINQAVGQSDPTGASPITFTAVFSEPVTGFTNSEISFAGSTAGGTLSASITGSGPTYTVSVSGMTTPGTVVASIPAAAAADGAGNNSTASSSTDNIVTWAPVAPTVTINQGSTQLDPTHTSPVRFDVVFSQPVTGFATGDVSFTGSSVGGTLVGTVSGVGTTYTVDVTGMTTPGTVVASIPAGVASGVIGNAASTSTDNSVTYDATAPAVTINQAVGQSDPASSLPIAFTVVFSEPVTGFTNGDISFTGSTAAGTLAASISGSGPTYTVNVTGATTGGTVVATIAAGAVTDAAGNNSAASTSTDNTVTWNPTVPTVTINQAAGQADPTHTSPISFTVAFSESVTGFDGSDISFAGSTAGGSLIAGVGGSGTTYTVTVTGMTTSGTVVASIPAGAAINGFSIGNAASTSSDNTVTWDATAPAVTINQAAGQGDPTATAPIAFDVVFSEPVTGFSGSDVSFTGSTAGGTLVAGVSGSGASYTVTVTGMTTAGTVVASIPAGAASDGVGNSSTASSSTDNTVTWSPNAPTVTINQAVGQNDPTNASPIHFTVVFSEAMTGFATGDVSFAGSTAGGTLVGTVSGSGPTYAVDVSGMTTPGTVVATIPGSVAVNSLNVGNAASSSTDNTVTWDATAPTVTINQGGSQADPTATSPVTFTVTFSEPVTSFTNADVSFTGSTAGGTLLAGVTGGGANYTVTVTGMTTAGAVVASIPASAATDAAGNSSAASTSTDNTVTWNPTAPTVTINQAVGQNDPANASPIHFTVVFSEAVTGFATGDVSLTSSTVGGTLLGTVGGSGTTYTVDVTGMTTPGTVVATIPAGAAMNTLNVANAASTSTDNTVTWDATAPTVTINQASGQADPTATSPISFTVVFSEPVSGFDGSDIAFGGSTAGGTLAAGVSGSGASYTVTVTGMTSAGTVVASIPAGAAMDAATNSSAASTSTDHAVAWSPNAPTVTINQTVGQTDPTNASPVHFTVVFSESVTGFATGDVSFAGSTAGGTLVGTVSGSGTTYTVDVTGMTTPGTVIATIPAGVAMNTLNVANAASSSTDNTVTWDAASPTVTIDQGSSQVDPTATSPITFDVVFSEPVTGFIGSDVSFTGSTAGGTLVAGVSGSGATYTVTVTGMTSAGTVVASIPAGAAKDAANNNSAASTSTDNTVAWNATAAAVTINQAVGQNDPTNASPIHFTVIFSEVVTGFATGDVSFTGSTAGGTLAGTVSGSGTTYTVDVTGMTSAGTVVASIPAGVAANGVGVGNAASTGGDHTVTWDATAPTVTVNQASGQADPASTSPLSFTVVFSEPVTGFTGSSVALSGSTAGGTLAANVSGSGPTYTVTVTGMTSPGTVIATIPAGAVTDAVGNANTASTSTDNTVTWNPPAPTVTINQAAGQPDPAHTSPITFTVVFSAPVTGFTDSDVVLTGSTVGGSLSASVSGGGANYTITVTGMTTPGMVVASIPAGAAVSSLSAGNVASTSTDNTVTWDATPPMVTIDQASGQADPASSSPIRFTVVFSEPVTGFTGGDVVLGGSAGGTLAASVTGSGTTYTVSVTGMTAAGTVMATVAAGAATDAAGNSSAASTSTDNIVNYTVASLSFYGLLDPWGPPGPGTYNGTTYTSGKVFKTNSTLPLKWGYGSGGTLVDSSASHPQVTIGPLSNCEAVDGSGVDTAVAYTGPGSTTVSYDASSKLWQLNVKLDNSFGSDKCYLVQVADPVTGVTSTLFPFKTKK